MGVADPRPAAAMRSEQHPLLTQRVPALFPDRLGIFCHGLVRFRTATTSDTTLTRLGGKSIALWKLYASACENSKHFLGITVIPTGEKGDFCGRELSEDTRPGA